MGSSSQTLEGGDTSYRFTTSPTPGTSTPTRIWLIGDADYTAAAAHIDKLPFTLQDTPSWLNTKAEIKLAQGSRQDALALYHRAIERIDAMPTHRQNLPGFVAARHKASTPWNKCSRHREVNEFGKNELMPCSDGDIKNSHLDLEPGA